MAPEKEDRRAVFGKARVTKKPVYDVLALAVPILCHTLFDMFIIGMMSIVGDPKSLTGMSAEEIVALPYANYMIPLLVCALVTVAVSFIALILSLRQIGVWSKRGEKQELLQ